MTAHQQPQPLPQQLGPALAMLWQRHRGLIVERIADIEAAAVAVLRGELGEEQRGEAERIAHKLAGSLGTFGFEDGSRAALEAESMLRADPIDARRLSSIVEVLRVVADGATLSRPAAPDPLAGTAGAGTGSRVLLASADPELAARFTVEALTLDWSIEVVADVAAAVAATRDAGDRAVAAALIDTRDEAPDTLYARLGEVAALVPTFVLGDQDGLPERLAATRSGTAGYLARSQSAGQIVGFVSRILARNADQPVVVLAVGDGRDRAGGDLIRSIVAAPAYRLVVVDDPRDAWTALEEHRPEVALIDADTSIVSGMDLCRVLRGDPRWQSLPVILLTGSAGAGALDAGALDAGFRAGADDVLPRSQAGAELGARLRSQVERARVQRVVVDTDPLTGVAHRGRAGQMLEHLLRLAERGGEPVGIVRIEPDQLDALRSRHGNAVGDLALRRLGGMLRRSFRGEDVVGRWDGGGLIVGMFRADSAQCVERVRRLLDSHAQEPLIPATGEQVFLRFNAGVAARPTDGSTLASLVRAAENALDRARVPGGRVVSADTAPTAGQVEVDVVVVEDDEVVATVIEHSLEMRGLRMRLISDGLQAADELCGTGLRTRLILLDVGLPGLDGFGVLSRLREAGVLASTPTIMLTARSGEAETLRALGLGATEHIAKPFSVPVLLNRVDRALGQGRR
jgi:diguanylate cyclase (GGDEF)-like protein